MSPRLKKQDEEVETLSIPISTSVAVEEPQEAEVPKYVLSELDGYVHERVKAQPKSLGEVEIKVGEPTKPGKHVLSLPDEVEEKYSKKYIFRWVNKDKRAIDRALDVRGWTIVNRTLMRDLSRRLFSINGTIERGDTILAFMPKAKAEMLRRAPGERSQAVVKNVPMRKYETDPRFYQAKLSPAQEAGYGAEERVEGRDFGQEPFTPGTESEETE